MWIICLGINVAELDRLMSNITDSSIARMHWLVVSENMDKLGSLNALWQSSTQVITCQFPKWGQEIESCVESILEFERHPNSQAVILKPPYTILSGNLQNLPRIDFITDKTFDSFYSDTARLLEDWLNESIK